MGGDQETSPSVDAVYDLEHVATFVESDHELTPEDIIAEVVRLDTKSIVPTRSRIELNSKGIKVMKADKNEIFESAPWKKIYDPGLIMPTGRGYENKIYLIFRINLVGVESMGYRSELLIFSVDSEKEGRIILEKILNYSEKMKEPDRMSVSSLGTIKVAHHTFEKPQRESYNKRHTVTSKYGNLVYMLSRCLDDIERFGKRLNKCVHFDDVSGEYQLVTDTKVKPHGYRELTECVRKIKYALNLNSEFEKEVPETSRKIFTRLIKITFWLDDICQAKVITAYDAHSVRDVVEPLLYEDTIASIKTMLPDDLQTKWERLGPTWNTPTILWPNPLKSYMPQFKTHPRFRVLRPERLHQFLEVEYIDHTLRPVYKVGTLGEQGTMPKVTQPNFRNKEHERFYRKLQDNGKKLCFATIRHMCSKPSELFADQGEVFEVLDDTNDDWWTVENYTGDKGQLPRWKLRSLNLEDTVSRFSELDDGNSPTRFPRSDRMYSSTTSHPDSVFVRSDHNEVSLRKKSETRPRSPHAHTDGAIPAGYSERPGLNPIVLYLSPEQIKIMKNQPSSVPIILMPYNSHPQRESRRSRGTYRSKSSVTLRENRGTVYANRSSTISPRSQVIYRPTIELNAKGKRVR